MDDKELELSMRITQPGLLLYRRVPTTAGSREETMGTDSGGGEEDGPRDFQHCVGHVYKG